MLHGFQELVHVVGEWGGICHLFARQWVDEAEAGGVKRVTTDDRLLAGFARCSLEVGQKDAFLSSVELVCSHRQLLTCEVNTDLMRATRLRIEFDECVSAEAFKNTECSHRLTSRSIDTDHLFLAVGIAATKSVVDSSFPFFWFAARDCQITLAHGSLFELVRQGTVGKVVFCDYQNSRRLLVQPMNDSGALLAADA